MLNVAQNKMRVVPENKFWTAPRIWSGPVVIAATGPSLTQEQLDYVRGKARVIAVNDAYTLAPWADVIYAADETWWGYHFEKMEGIRSIMVTATKHTISPRINVIGHDSDGQRSTFDNPGFLRGSNSGAEAMHLGFHMGGNPLILLGCDCCENGKQHFFGKHPPQLARDGNYNKFSKSFEEVGRHISELGVEIINCSPISTIQAFRKARIEEVL